MQSPAMMVWSSHGRIYNCSSPVCSSPKQTNGTGAKDISDYLKREFTYLNNVKVILALGSIGYTAISKELNITLEPKFNRGLEVKLKSGEIILCSYHVSQQNTFTGRLTEEMFDAVLERAKGITKKRTKDE